MMKKILLILVTLILLPINASAAEQKVRIYLFRGYNCEHCESALNYMDANRELIPDNVEIMTYEVWENDNNEKLQDKVADQLNVDKTKNYGVPFFVIGNDYIKGYNDGTTFKEVLAIAKEYTSGKKEYQDVVEEIRLKENIEAKSLSLDDLFSKPSTMVTIIVYSVFGVIILGFLGMILFSRKRS